jgi:hypothetical protein
MVAEDTVAVIGLATTVGRNPYGVGTVSDAELDARLWIARRRRVAVGDAFGSGVPRSGGSGLAG